jgi:hypothetical protein
MPDQLLDHYCFVLEFRVLEAQDHREWEVHRRPEDRLTMLCCLPSEQTDHWWQLFLGIFPFEYQTARHSKRNRNVSHWLGKLNNEYLLYCLHQEEVVLETQLLQAVVVEEEGEVPAFSRFK